MEKLAICVAYMLFPML